MCVISSWIIRVNIVNIKKSFNSKFILFNLLISISDPLSSKFLLRSINSKLLIEFIFYFSKRIFFKILQIEFISSVFKFKADGKLIPLDDKSNATGVLLE